MPGRATAPRRRCGKTLGLDLPLWQQYFKSLIGLFTGDTGISYYYARPVSELFAERIGPTLSLGAIVMAVTVVVGIPLGVLAAVRHNTLLDRVTMSTAVIGSTVPNFVLGILLIFVFALKLRLLPSGNTGTPMHYIMPVIAMSVGPTASAAPADPQLAARCDRAGLSGLRAGQGECGSGWSCSSTVCAMR